MKINSDILLAEIMKYIIYLNSKITLIKFIHGKCKLISKRGIALGQLQNFWFIHPFLHLVHDYLVKVYRSTQR